MSVPQLKRLIALSCQERAKVIDLEKPESDAFHENFNNLPFYLEALIIKLQPEWTPLDIN